MQKNNKTQFKNRHRRPFASTPLRTLLFEENVFPLDTKTKHASKSRPWVLDQGKKHENYPLMANPWSLTSKLSVNPFWWNDKLSRRNWQRFPMLQTLETCNKKKSAEKKTIINVTNWQIFCFVINTNARTWNARPPSCSFVFKQTNLQKKNKPKKDQHQTTAVNSLHILESIVLRKHWSAIIIQNAAKRLYNIEF